MSKYDCLLEAIDASKFNVDAVIGVAIGTAFLRSDWDNQTDITEVSSNALSEIAEMAEDYCDWIGLRNIQITHADVKEAIWGEG